MPVSSTPVCSIVHVWVCVDDCVVLNESDRDRYDSNYFSTEFQLLQRLGHGSFAEAYKVRDARGNMYAIKKTREPFHGIKDRYSPFIHIYSIQASSVGGS
jgi:serine/threonine protein kinase